MADQQIVTNIVAKSDFSNLIADVQRVTNSLSKLQQQFAGSNRALAGQISATNAMFKETMLKTGQYSSHFVSLTSDVEKFGRNLDGGRLKLRDYFRTYQEHTRTTGGLIRDLAKQQVQLQNSVLQPLGRNAQGLMQYNVHIPRGLDLTKNKTSILKQELQIMNKVIQDGGVQLINWGKNTQWAGRQLTVGLTLPLAAFGKAAADAFRVADQELTRLTKVYGDVAGSSSQELSKIRNEVSATAKELSSAMGVSFNETISLAADIAATGKTGNELLSSISETTRLAVLGEVDRQEAMKATLAIQSAFKQNTEELSESINFLNAVENQTSTTLNDLVEAIPKAGPVIQGLGGSIQDLALYLTAMREGGINASEGANALKSALASLINPTDVAVGKFESFGIDLLGIVNKNAGNVTDTLFALQAALDQLNPLQKQQAIEQLFGKFQFSRLNALFENLGRQGSQTLQVLDLMKASAGDLEAVAGRELAAVTESAAGKYRRAVEGLKAELAGVGEDFLTIGTKLINVLSGIIDFAQKLPDPIKKLATFAGAFTAIIGPVIMLTGVLANFFGYIIKGIGHFKALFKGAEGFKLLTPELMAARDASNQLGNEFYDDSKAAATLSLAIKKLNEDLVLLEQNARKATVSSSGLGQVMATTGGTPFMPMGATAATTGSRLVIPGHPLLGGTSRAAAHLNPRNPNDPTSIFGLTMQPIPVNRKIGANPQVLMSERLPDVPGLTTVGGVSTGVVAAEHARYSALMATLGMQTKQEIDSLKKIIGLGGQVSKDLIDTFDDILPITQKLTANAAAQSASIVADLKAGKLTVEKARASIIAVNAELERMMGFEISQFAAQRGRTIDLTKAPLIDQPVVDASGKPNVRGMFRQGIFRDVMESLGRATRTRTMGGPYSIETTRPQGLNMGGKVFYNNGDQVPGPNVNADVVPAMLTPGEFVIRRGVAQQDPEGMRALNEGRAMVIPVERNVGGVIPMLRALQMRRSSISGLRVAGQRSGRQAYTPNQLNFEAMSRSATRGGTTLPRLQQSGYLTEEETASLSGMIGAHGISRRFMSNIGSRTSQGAYPTSSFEDIYRRFSLTGSMTPTGSRKSAAERYVREGRTAQVLPGSVVHIDGALNTKIKAGTATRSDFAGMQGYQMTNLLDFLSSQGIPPQLARKIAADAALKLRMSIPSRGINEASWAKAIEKSEQSAIVKNARELSMYTMPFAANRGGMVPGYNIGGGITRAGLLARLGAKFKYEGKSYEGADSLQTYRIKAMDPQGGKKYFDQIPGLSDKGKGALYDATLRFFNTTGIKGRRVNGKNLFTPESMLTAFPTIASFAMTEGSKFLPESDLAVLKSIAGNSGTLRGTIGSSTGGMAKVYGRLFKANKGGMVPGYFNGGGVRKAGGMGGMLLRDMLFGSLGYMGGSSLGGMLGGTGGSMFGGMLGSMLPMMLMGRESRSGITSAQRLGLPGVSPYGQTLAEEMGLTPSGPSMPIGKGLGRKQSVFAGTRFAPRIEEFATSQKALPSIIGKTLASITKLNLALGVGTTAIFAANKAWNNYKETQKTSAAAFGMTEESAQKAGLSYTNYGLKIKEAVEAQKLFVDQNMITYESLQSAGTPFKMTIAEYKKLRKEVKETMQEQLKVLNATKRPDVLRVASQLKEQLMAAGLSADQASKRIFALLKISNKSDMTLQALSSKQFQAMTTPQAAAASSVETFNFATQFENAKDQTAALNTALMAINTGVEDFYNKAEKVAKKKNKDFDATTAAYEAEKNQLDIIANKVKNQKSIGEDVLETMKKQNPEVAKLINSSDSVVSIFQKLRIVARGFTGDLSLMNQQQVEALYKLQIATAQAVQATNQAKGGLLEKQYQTYGKLTKRIKELEKAAKGQSVQQQISDRDALKTIDKKIKRINDEADARKKALQEAQNQANYQIDIEKAQLEYKQAIATGDMGAAAQAQLNIRSLVGQRQSQLTEDQIERERQSKLKPLEAQREAIQNKIQGLADKASIAAENLDALRKTAKTQKDKMDEVNSAMAALKIAVDLHKDDLEKYKTTDEFKSLAGNLVDAVQKAGITIASPTLPDVRQGQLKTDVGQQALDLLAKAGTSIDTIVAQKGITVTATGDIVIGGKKINMGDVGLPKKTKEGETFGAEKRTIDAKTLKKAGEEAQSGKKTQTYVPATGGPGYDIFDWKGKTYAIDKNNNVIYEFDYINQKLGPRAKMAGGGVIYGPGTGTSDSIPAMLSSGEYVVKAAAVQKAGVPLLDKINNMAMGGLATKYNVPNRVPNRIMMASGGQTPLLGGNIVMQNTYNIPQNLTKEEVGRYIVDLELKELKRAGYDRSR